MRTAAQIKLLPAELGMVKTAMKAYSRNLIGSKKRLFDIALNRVLASDNGTFLMDGMELECVRLALCKYAWFHYANHNRNTAGIYFELAYWVKEKKAEFQAENGPKIKQLA